MGGGILAAPRTAVHIIRVVAPTAGAVPCMETEGAAPGSMRRGGIVATVTAATKANAAIARTARPVGTRRLAARAPRHAPPAQRARTARRRANLVWPRARAAPRGGARHTRAGACARSAPRAHSRHRLEHRRVPPPLLAPRASSARAQQVPRPRQKSRARAAPRGGYSHPRAGARVRAVLRACTTRKRARLCARAAQWGGGRP